MTRNQLIDLLVKDFATTTPTATYGEVLEVKLRLDGFDIEDLRLLARSLVSKPPAAPSNDHANEL